MRVKWCITEYAMALILFCFATVLVGCASKGVPPLQNISDADMAIRAAKESSATVNAPLDVRIAEEKLQQARQNVKAEDYVSARRLADEALMDAKIAEVKSRTQTVKNMEKELRDSIEILENEIKRSQKKN